MTALVVPLYEFREMSIPSGLGRHAVVRMLTDHAEYGHWELARVRLYPDGQRKVWLKRRLIKVQRTA